MPPSWKNGFEKNAKEKLKRLRIEFRRSPDIFCDSDILILTLLSASLSLYTRAMTFWRLISNIHTFLSRVCSKLSNSALRSWMLLYNSSTRITENRSWIAKGRYPLAMYSKVGIPNAKSENTKSSCRYTCRPAIRGTRRRTARAVIYLNFYIFCISISGLAYNLLKTSSFKKKIFLDFLKLSGWADPLRKWFYFLHFAKSIM